MTTITFPATIATTAQMNLDTAVALAGVNGVLRRHSHGLTEVYPFQIVSHDDDRRSCVMVQTDQANITRRIGDLAPWDYDVASTHAQWSVALTARPDVTLTLGEFAEAASDDLGTVSVGWVVAGMVVRPTDETLTSNSQSGVPAFTQFEVEEVLFDRSDSTTRLVWHHDGRRVSWWFAPTATFRVVSSPAAAVVGEQPATGRRFGQAIPRTAREAKLMLAAEPVSPELANALRRLALFLPGGRVESQAVEFANGADLCGVFDRTVSGALGWGCRDGHGDYDRSHRFADMVAEFESDNASANVETLLATFARRYEQGGAVNEALTDAILNNLERHKYAAANEMLESLGFTGVDVQTEYEVTVSLTRTITIRQDVTITVEAADEEEAADLATNDVSRLADESDSGDWYDDHGNCVGTMTTYRSDIDDYEVTNIS